MAKLTREDVFQLARLARLSLSDKEADAFSKEITEILNHVELLQSVDIKGEDPTYQVTGLSNVMRPDIIKDYGSTPADLLKNAPAIHEGHIKVKRVL